MRDIFDIYDKRTLKLVKPNVSLTRKGTHKDLNERRYIRLRTEAEPPRYDLDELISRVNLLMKHYERQK